MNFKQYEEIINLQENESSEIRKDVKIQAIIKGLNYHDLEIMPYQDMLVLLKNTPDKFDLKASNNKVVYSFTHKDKQYKLAENIDNISFYQYNDILTYLKNKDWLSFFVVMTFDRSNYIMSGKLVEEFETRKKELEDLPFTIWYPYSQELLKKKNMQILSSKNFINPAVISQMEKDFIELIIQTLTSSLSQMTTQKGTKSSIRSFMTIQYLRFIIFLCKKLKPKRTISLMNILSKILINNHEK